MFMNKTDKNQDSKKELDLVAKDETPDRAERKAQKAAAKKAEKKAEKAKKAKKSEKGKLRKKLTSSKNLSTVEWLPLFRAFL